jgi:hypothetical protein
MFGTSQLDWSPCRRSCVHSTMNRDRAHRARSTQEPRRDISPWTIPLDLTPPVYGVVRENRNGGDTISLRHFGIGPEPSTNRPLPPYESRETRISGIQVKLLPGPSIRSYLGFSSTSSLHSSDRLLLPLSTSGRLHPPESSPLWMQSCNSSTDSR